MPDRPALSLRHKGRFGPREQADASATDPNLPPVEPAHSGDSGHAGPSADMEDRAPTAPLQATPVRTTLHPGVLLDRRYQLQRHISSREPVQLWQGEDQVLARPVAIRLLVHNGSVDARDDTERLLGAARRAGQLAHNGAASTYDATTTDADGLPLTYVVSEWVQGISLLELLRDGPLLPERAAEVVLSVARVVAAAHAGGLTHGDLHPGDVIITSHGLIKVLDLEMRAALSGREPAERRTRDVTCLGALLYASLTARWPLGAGRGLPAAECDSSGHCRPPRQLRAGVPRELDALAMAALGTPPPGQVQPSAPEMVTALEGIIAALPERGQPGPGDDPASDTPAAQAAKEAQAQRLARASAARHRTVRRRVLPAALLVLLALAAWLVGVAVGRLPGHSSKGPASDEGGTQRGVLVQPTAVTDFDPLGDGAENPTGVPLAHDNNPATAWSTEIYTGSPWGGNPTKTGVGLKVDLGRPVSISMVKLQFQQPGVSVEVRYAAVDSASSDAYTVAATSGESPAAVQVLKPNTGPHRYWLIWLTALPKVDTASGPRYSANLAELSFYS